MSIKIGVIGVGNMGGAMVKKLSEHRDTYTLFAYDINKVLLDETVTRYSVKAAQSVPELVSACDIIIAAVKPIYMKDVLKECAESFDPSKIFVTVAAGISIDYYKQLLGHEKKIVRTMPNTPALMAEGMTVIAFDDLIGPAEKERIKSIFACVGRVEEMDESLMNAVVALTGSSPAYVYMLIEAMADAAVQTGIQREVSYRLASQAVLGAAKMVLETGKHPGELKDMVCSPGGTTIEAVAALERMGFRNAVITAMGACTEKAREIGKEKR